MINIRHKICLTNSIWENYIPIIIFRKYLCKPRRCPFSLIAQKIPFLCNKPKVHSTLLIRLKRQRYWFYVYIYIYVKFMSICICLYLYLYICVRERIPPIVFYREWSINLRAYPESQSSFSLRFLYWLLLIVRKNYSLHLHLNVCYS